MKPVVIDDIYEGGEKKEQEATTPGFYKMTLASTPKVKKTRDGREKLVAFFAHIKGSDEAKRFKGVEGAFMLEGEDKNGNPLARQVADFLYSLGVDKADAVLIANKQEGSGVTAVGNPPEGEEWKGTAAQIALRGEDITPLLVGREVSVKVEAYTYEGKTKTRAGGTYKAS